MGDEEVNGAVADVPKVSIVLRTLPNIDALDRYTPSPYVRVHTVQRLPKKLSLTPDKEAPRVRIPCPPSHDPISGKFWISTSGVDGLFCIVYKGSGLTTDIAIWNPCTDSSRIVTWPGGIWNSLDDSICFVGFGYDAGIDDYKVVVVSGDTTLRDSAANGFFVTALKSGGGVWRRIQTETPLFVKPTRLIDSDKELGKGDLDIDVRSLQFETATLREHLYWVCSSGLSVSLLSFSLREERVSLTIPSPMHNLRLRSDEWVKLTVSNGFLHICILKMGDYSARMHLWKRHMIDGSNEESWVKQKGASFRNLCYCASAAFTSDGILIVSSISTLYSDPSLAKRPFYTKPFQYDPRGFWQTYHFLEMSSSASP